MPIATTLSSAIPADALRRFSSRAARHQNRQGAGSLAHREPAAISKSGSRNRRISAPIRLSSPIGKSLKKSELPLSGRNKENMKKVRSRISDPLSRNSKSVHSSTNSVGSSKHKRITKNSAVNEVASVPAGSILKAVALAEVPKEYADANIQVDSLSEERAELKSQLAQAEKTYGDVLKACHQESKVAIDALNDRLIQAEAATASSNLTLKRSAIAFVIVLFALMMEIFRHISSHPASPLC